MYVEIDIELMFFFNVNDIDFIGHKVASIINVQGGKRFSSDDSRKIIWSPYSLPEKNLVTPSATLKIKHSPTPHDRSTHN